MHYWALRAAAIEGDVISELPCLPLKVRLNRNLIHGNFTATRLLFEPVQTDHRTNWFPRVFQLNQRFLPLRCSVFPRVVWSSSSFSL